MRKVDKARTSNNVQSKRSGKNGRREQKPQQVNGTKKTAKEPKAVDGKEDSSNSASDSTTGSEASEVCQRMDVHHVDDANSSEDAYQESNSGAVNDTAKKGGNMNSGDLEKDEEGKDDGSDSEGTRDMLSSQGDSVTADDEKVERISVVPKSKNSTSRDSSKPTTGSNHGANIFQSKMSNGGPTKSIGVSGETAQATGNCSWDNTPENMEVHPSNSSESSEVTDVNGHVQEVKEADVWKDASNGGLGVGSENETVDAEENGKKEEDEASNQKIEEFEMRIEKLEEELREVAALEVSLYSVVPEHGSSAHKLHTPARRLSRLYIHACKHWTQSKRATIARNTVSGLILVAKSCGNDVSRLTFWLSNTVALREIICQAFGSACNSSPLPRFHKSNGSGRNSLGKSSTLKRKGSSGGKQVNGFMKVFEDWQDTGTLIAALEKVESWVFSRIVESVWWQVFTPHMQSPEDDPSASGTTEKLLGPALGDQQQGSFSINLWNNALQGALLRLCPIRGGGHECGCLPVLARMVMEQCIARLDVAMFNAILRESAHQIPTDPVSDPILDSKVLPIPAGDLSFGSGAQLKNAIGNWSRWLTDMFGLESGDSLDGEHHNDEDNYRQGGDSEHKPFILLSDLSDLLMLPKDMLMDLSIREEVCPSIGLSLVKRILCNFTPDEFCPDPVPGAVLEALNAESIVRRKLSGDSTRSFPYTASPVYYTPPLTADVALKLAEAGERYQLARNVSMIQRKGCTSDEELEELDSPLTSIIDKVPLSPAATANGSGKPEHVGYMAINARYELLREVWSA